MFIIWLSDWLSNSKLFVGQTEFWTSFIENYLKPLDTNKKHEEQVQKELLKLRNKVRLFDAFKFIQVLVYSVNYV